ncbi:hypothetical protein [Micromonospora carbonacea]|uniref:hypothetical protein n=1 Tax=Micromonospora carbonacea TaxID=47853 RepID=UPI00371EACAB
MTGPQDVAVDSLWRNTDGGISTVRSVKEIGGDIYVRHTTEGPGDEWSVSLTIRDAFLARHTPQETP